MIKSLFFYGLAATTITQIYPVDRRMEYYSDKIWYSGMTRERTKPQQNQETKFINAANWILTFHLFKYAQEGNLQALEELLQTFPNLNVQVKDTHQKTPADYAAQNGHTDCAEFIESHALRPESQPHKTIEWDSAEKQSNPFNFGSPSYNADDELGDYELFEEIDMSLSSDDSLESEAPDYDSDNSSLDDDLDSSVSFKEVNMDQGQDDILQDIAQLFDELSLN